MKNLLISAGLALGLGAVSFASANAAPITRATVVAPAATSDVGCRTVKRVTYRNGMKRVVSSQECDRRPNDHRMGRDRKSVV